MHLFPIKSKVESVDLARDDIGALLAAAMRLGAIRIWQHTDLYDNPRQAFDVTIKFKRGNSIIEAKGSHSSLVCALDDAIRQAASFHQAGER